MLVVPDKRPPAVMLCGALRAPELFRNVGGCLMMSRSGKGFSLFGSRTGLSVMTPLGSRVVPFLRHREQPKLERLVDASLEGFSLSSGSG